MKKNAVVFLAWFVLALSMGIVLYLRLENLMIVGLAILGSFVGYVLPVFLDVLLPRVMRTDITLDKTLAKDVIKEGISQISQGNLHTQQAPATPLRSYPLLLAYVLAASIVITSSRSFFGRGFIFGLGLSLVLDLWLSRRPIAYLKSRWFSVFHANLSDQEFDYFVYGMVGVYVLVILIGLVV